MTLNPFEYIPDKFSSLWNVSFLHLVMLVILALKNNMYNTIKLETQDQRVNQLPKINCSVTTITVQYGVKGCHINFSCTLKLGWVSTG